MNSEKRGAFIKKLREEKGWTQEELANKLCYSREAVSKWERGRCEPDIEIIKKLSSLFNIKIEELIAGEKNPSKNIVLDLYDVNNKNIKKFKLIIISILTGVVMIMLLVFINYFINQYRSVNIYTMHGVGDSYSVANGLIVRTNDCIYFQPGLILNKHYKDIINISKLELYYKTENGEEKLNTKYTKNILIQDKKNVKGIFDFAKFENIIDNLYLRVYLNNGVKEDIYLNIDKDYINDKIFLK